MDEPPTHGMSSWERILITALGTIIFSILVGAVTQILTNTSRLTALEIRIMNHDAEMDRIYKEMTEHRQRTENTIR